MSSPGKEQALRKLGAESVVDRTASNDLKIAVRKATGGVIIDAVMDLVGGDMTNRLIDVLIERMAERKTYPRLSNAGASAGSTSKIFWSQIYLYQVQLFGVSHGTREEAEQLIEWIRCGQLSPVLHRTFRLSDIRNAEDCFASKSGDYINVRITYR
ncbi:MAG: zinc-binding dehydrogenase [Thiomicrorhabdus sp.]|nr:zinc-binding dehydrogenase [Thiomicrorhabdus sp.]